MSEWETIGKAPVEKAASPPKQKGGWETIGKAEQPNKTNSSYVEPNPVGMKFMHDPNKQTDFETALQANAGGFQQLGSDLGGFISQYTIDPVSSFLDEKTPPEVKQFLQQGAENFAKLPNVQSSLFLLQKGGEAWDAFEKANPRVAKDAKSIATLLTAGLVGMGQTKKAAREALESAITPYKNQANMGAMIDDGRIMPGSGLKKFRFNHTDAVKNQLSVMESVPGYKGMQTAIQRHEMVKKEIVQTARSVDANLRQISKTPRGQISAQKIRNGIDGLSDRMKKRYDLEYSDKFSPAEYKKIKTDLLARLYGSDGVSVTPVSAFRLHKARQAIDSKYNAIKGERFTQGIGNPTREEMRYRAIRDMLNDLVDEALPETAVGRQRLTTLYELKAMQKQKAVKGHYSYWLDVKENVPLASSVRRIAPNR